MSSTTNVQNLLVNIFRPIYAYDGTTTLFTPRIGMSNIDSYTGNTVVVLTAAVGDSNSNVYVGVNAGNPYSTPKSCRGVTAIGYEAGSNIFNVSNSTYLGLKAGANAQSASNVVAIGANTTGNGTSNVYVGTGTGVISGIGNSNVFIGAGITGTGSGSILIGTGLTDGSANSVFKLGSSYLTGNMSTKWLGIGTTSPIDPNSRLDVSGNVYVLGQQGINMVPVRTLDVNGNFRASDAFGTLDFSNGVTSSSGGLASSQGTISNAAIGSTTTIATLKKGVILVSAQDTASSNHYQSIQAFCTNPANGTSATAMTNVVQAGDVTVVFQSGGSNIQISNATSVRSIAWSVTYFPLP
jgi:hypothetical protein